MTHISTCNRVTPRMDQELINTYAELFSADALTEAHCKLHINAPDKSLMYIHLIPYIIAVRIEDLSSQQIAILHWIGFARCVVCKEFRAKYARCKRCVKNPAERTAPQECSICLGNMTCKNSIKLPNCSHAFHKTCIATWFAKPDSVRQCPNCRTSS